MKKGKKLWDADRRKKEKARQKLVRICVLCNVSEFLIFL